jgi:hypothetical protein
MEFSQSHSLQMPSFLHGAYTSVHREALKEGRRCAEHYRKSGSFPAPREMLDVEPGEPVIAHEVVDFQREQPAWRLHMLSSVMKGLFEALDWQDSFHVGDVYEASCRETAWSSLYFAVSQVAPKSAERMALRIEAVLRSWEALQSGRYLFSTPGVPLELDGLMNAACDWVMAAWCPEGSESVRRSLEVAATRMARATREDSLEAILRQMPRVLPFARGLKHRDVLSNPDFWRQRLAALEPESFERLSGAWPALLLEELYAWDRQLAVT